MDGDQFGLRRMDGWRDRWRVYVVFEKAIFDRSAVFIICLSYVELLRVFLSVYISWRPCAVGSIHHFQHCVHISSFVRNLITLSIYRQLRYCTAIAAKSNLLDSSFSTSPSRGVAQHKPFRSRRHFHPESRSLTAQPIHTAG